MSAAIIRGPMYLSLLLFRLMPGTVFQIPTAASVVSLYVVNCVGLHNFTVSHLSSVLSAADAANTLGCETMSLQLSFSHPERFQESITSPI